MDKLAMILDGKFVYWNSIILTLAALTAICFFLAFYLCKCGNAVAGFAAVPVALVSSIVCSRFFHWFFLPDSYGGFFTALTDYSSGGYALMGCFLGCFLAAVLTRLLYLHQDLGEVLDCMAISGCAGIAVGRLASFFNGSGRGNIVNSQGFFVWPVTNTVSGAEEYRLATFLIQAIVAAVLFFGLAWFYYRGNRKGILKSGDTCYIFLLIYGASQVVLDSTRYDSLFFRSNGFIGVVQVLGALGLALAIIVFSRRMVKAVGFKFWQVLLWTGIAAGIGGAGFMEYYVQRRGNEAAFAYSIMMLCLGIVVGLTLLVRMAAVREERRG